MRGAGAGRWPRITRLQLGQDGSRRGDVAAKGQLSVRLGKLRCRPVAAAWLRHANDCLRTTLSLLRAMLARGQ
jgi:hypothetical protein